MSFTKKYQDNNRPLLMLVILLVFPLCINSQDLPDIPDIIRVTVDHSDNGILIQWMPSTDTNIAVYNIYKMNEGASFEKLFAVSPNQLECKHMNSGLRNLAYAVTAEDNADPSNESVFGQNVHRAVDLAVEFDLCSQSNELQWTAYEGWEGQISGYRIYGGQAGETLELLKFVQPSSRTFTQENVDIASQYCYYLETVHTSGLVSLSAIDTVSTSYPEAPSYLTIDQVSVVDQNSVELRFSADITGSINSFKILRRSNSNTPFTEIETLWNIGASSQVIVDQFPTGSISYQYLVQSIFQPAQCSSPLVVSESNTANSILLLNEIQNQVVSLYWTPYETYEPGLAGYIIQRRTGSGVFSDITTVGPNTTMWQEPIVSLINGSQPGEVQYQVIALGNANGEGVEGKSYSNITTAAVETHMQVPSAFTPGSNDMNFEFKPLMDFAPAKYTMLVMDRVGRKMFETTNPDDGWDGRFMGGEFVNEAVYVYYIQYTDYTGLFKTFTGNVTVLYP
jgi:gliding motility-associated-like protein